MDIKLDFVEYRPTPLEKHEGIASVKLHTDVGAIIFRFHILRSKKDNSWYHSSMGYRVSGKGQDAYLMPFYIENPEISEAIARLLQERIYSILT